MIVSEPRLTHEACERFVVSCEVTSCRVQAGVRHSADFLDDPDVAWRECTYWTNGHDDRYHPVKVSTQ